MQTNHQVKARASRPAPPEKIEGEVAVFLESRNLLTQAVTMCHMRDLVLDHPNKIAATTLPSGRSIAVVRTETAVFCAVAPQTTPRTKGKRVKGTIIKDLFS